MQANLTRMQEKVQVDTEEFKVVQATWKYLLLWLLWSKKKMWGWVLLCAGKNTSLWVNLFKAISHQYPSLCQVLAIADNDGLKSDTNSKLNEVGNITLNSSDYDKEDYFLPSAALKRVFKEQIENGTLPDNCEIQQFRSIFPCPQDSVKFDLEKQIDTARVKQTAAEEQKNWSVTKERKLEYVYNQPIKTLVQVLRELCN